MLRGPRVRVRSQRSFRAVQGMQNVEIYNLMSLDCRRSPIKLRHGGKLSYWHRGERAVRPGRVPPVRFSFACLGGYGQCRHIVPGWRVCAPCASCITSAHRMMVVRVCARRGCDEWRNGRDRTSTRVEEWTRVEERTRVDVDASGGTDPSGRRHVDEWTMSSSGVAASDLPSSLLKAMNDQRGR